MSDLIDRHAAIESIRECALEAHSIRRFEMVQGYLNAIECIEEEPSAEPERKTGHFIGTEFDGYADGSPVYYEWKCSECGCVFEDDEPTFNYCPNCGADMRGEINGSD